MLNFILGLIALLSLPLFWLSFNICGVRITIKEFFNEWRIQLNSDEPWGIFDQKGVM